MKVRFIFLQFVFFVVVINISIAQKNLNLDTLDQQAFTSLENNSPDASDNALLLLKESQKQNSSIHQINGYTILGIINKNKGHYITSTNHYLKALNVAEKEDDNGRISACYNNIGTVYHLQENYKKALSYFKKSLEIENQLNNPLQRSIRLNNIGEVYRDIDSFDLSLSYFNNSLLIEKEYNNNEGINYALIGIADVYLALDRITDAEISLNKLSNKIQSGDIELTILYNELQGSLFFKKKEYEKAIEKLEQAENLSNNQVFKIHLLDIYEREISLYNFQENWSKSVEKYKLYVDLKKQLNSIKIKNQLEDLTFQNELNKKELEIELIQEERDLAHNISNFEANLVWFLIASIVIIIVVIILGVTQIKSKK